MVSDDTFKLFTDDVKGEMRELRTDLKLVTKALQNLVKLETDQRRQDEAQGRMGKQLDKLQEKVETLQAQMSQGAVKLAVQGHSTGLFNDLVKYALAGLVSAGLVYLGMK